MIGKIRPAISQRFGASGFQAHPGAALATSYRLLPSYFIKCSAARNRPLQTARLRASDAL
jgi:hypothetical protein